MESEPPGFPSRLGELGKSADLLSCTCKRGLLCSSLLEDSVRGQQSACSRGGAAITNAPGPPARGRFRAELKSIRDVLRAKASSAPT